MKVKDPVESCGGVQKEHGYLGHFKNPEHLVRGHNSDPIPVQRAPLDPGYKFNVTQTFPNVKEKDTSKDEDYRQIINEFRAKGPK